MGCTSVLVFGDKAVEALPALRKLYTLSKSSPQLQTFLQASSNLICRQLPALTAVERVSFGHFSNLVELAETYESQGGSSVLCGSVLLTAIQIGEFLAFAEENPDIFTGRTTKTFHVGFGIGLLAASVAAAAGNTSDIITIGNHAVLFSFKLAIELTRRASLIQESNKPWGCVVAGTSYDEVQEYLDDHNKALPTTRHAYIGTLADTWLSVFGPPSTLENVMLSERFRDTAPNWLACSSAVHAPHLRPIDIQKIIGISSALDSPLASGSCFSSSTSMPFEAKTRRELFASAIVDIVQHPSQLEKTIANLSSVVRNEKNVAVVQFGEFQQTGSASKLLRQRLGTTHQIFTDHLSSFGDRAGTSSDDIAIIGMSGRFPGGDNLDEFWQILQEGKDVHQEVPSTRFDLNDFYDTSGKSKKNAVLTRFGCFLEIPGLFDNRFFNISPREAIQMDPLQRIFLMTTYEALEMAGYSPNSSTLHHSRISTYFGQSTEDWRTINKQQGIQAHYLPCTNRSFVPGRVNHHFKWGGGYYSIDTSCSSSATCIHLACASLIARECDMSVVGGGNICVIPEYFSGFSLGGFLSPTGSCKTFSESADGYCRGEAVGTVILKRLEDALATNDNILGVIAGTARNTNAGESSITYPGETAQQELFQKILRQSGVDPNEIGYVEMHGTGTKAGDLVEMNSVRNVFGRSRARPLYIGALKASIGHGEAAAGISSLIKALLMLKKGKIPPQPGPLLLNRKFPDLETAKMYISNGRSQAIPRSDIDSKRKLIINSFDAAGGNTCILLQDSCTNMKKGIDPRTHHVIICSARTSESLISNRNRLREYLQTHEAPLADLAYTTTARRIHYPYSELYVVESIQQLISQLENSPIPKQPTSAQAPLVFVFTGQSSQYTGMGSTLYKTSPRFHSILNSYDSLCTSQGFSSFIGVIRGTVDVALATAAEVQLAIVALEIGLAHFWQDLGLKPTAVIGHSLGEYSALCVAQVLSISDALYLVHERAALTEKHCTVGSYGMLAVPLSAKSAQELLRDAKLSWELCCLNAFASTVIGGSLDELDSLEMELKHKNIKSTRLDVQYAFHSSQMDSILGDFEKVAKRANFGHPQIPVVSSVTGSIVDCSGTFTASYLVRQTRQPVKFFGALNTLKAKGLICDGSAFIEIGPHPVCIGLVRSCFPNMRVTTLPSLQRGHSDWEMVSKCLAAVHDHRLNLDWEKFHNDYLDCLNLISLPSYAFEMKDYWASHQRQTTILDPTQDMTRPDFALSTTCLQRLESISHDKSAAVFVSYIAEPVLFNTIQGHIVDGVAICPASIFIDIACTAAKILLLQEKSGAKGQTLEVLDLNMTNPLVVSGKDPMQTIRTNVTVVPSGDFVTIQISSVSLDTSTEHAVCRVFVLNDESPTRYAWYRVQKLIEMRVNILSNPLRNNSCHRMAKDLMYRLFDSIVEYGTPFRVLENICVDKDFQDAVAELRMPQAPAQGSFTCNPFCIDALVHLPGFLLNCNLDKPKDDIHIASSIGQMVVLEDLAENQLLSCYATTRQQAGEGTTFCDVYLFRDAQLVALVSDICFRKISRSFFNSMTSRESATSSQLQRSSYSTLRAKQLQSTYTKSTLVTPDLVRDQKAQQPSSDAQCLFSLLLEVVASTTGVNAEEIGPESYFADIGVDSHMGIAITTEFKERTGMQLPAAFFHNFPKMADAEKELIAEASSSTSTVDLSAHANLTSTMPVHHSLANSWPEAIANLCATDHRQKVASDSHRAEEVLHPSSKILETSNLKARAILLQGSSSSTTTPLFLVAESSGSVAVYTHFPPLPHGRRIYGLESPFLDCPQDHVFTVPELARVYVELMLDTLPNGPYLVGGFSFASVYAYEIAYQLALLSKKVIGLLVIDMYVPPPARVGLSRFSLDGIGEGPLANITTRCSQLFPRFTDNQKDHMRATMRFAASYTPVPIPDVSLPRQTHIFWATKGVNENPYPNEHDDTLIGPAWMGVFEKPWNEVMEAEMVRLQQSWFFSKRETFGTNGWEKLVGEDIHIHQIDADHLSMVSPPGVHNLGKAIAEAVESCTK